MSVSFKRSFASYVKKAKKPLQLAIQDAVDLICEQPRIGQAKSGDLAGVKVYKFRFQNQEYLVAYVATADLQTLEFIAIDFYKVGSHENFYAELKKQL